MKCQYCGGSVEWQGPASNLTHTKCTCCGSINCEVPEEEIEEETTND